MKITPAPRAMSFVNPLTFAGCELLLTHDCAGCAGVESTLALLRLLRGERIAQAQNLIAVRAAKH